jgi:hypothetical protein
MDKRSILNYDFSPVLYRIAVVRSGERRRRPLEVTYEGGPFVRSTAYSFAASRLRLHKRESTTKSMLGITWGAIIRLGNWA